MSLLDQFGRKIDYLRISITDRCNLRCKYCMPPDGVEYKPHSSILSYEDIVRIVKVGVELGIRKVRVTGGEPLVRPGIIEFFKLLRQVERLHDISMTTNGVLLARYAQDLRKAGLQRVNISLDTLQKERYREITLRDQFDAALEGIEAALRVGFSPVKINVVLMKGVNDDEILDFVEMACKHPLHVRFIEFMPLGWSEEIQTRRYISSEEVKRRIQAEVDLVPAALPSNGPAKHYRIPHGPGTIGFITPISHSFCAQCNRLRLTADGKLRPCLANNLEIDLRDPNTGNLGDSDSLRSRFESAFKCKPGQHHFFMEENKLSARKMFQIGG